MRFECDEVITLIASPDEAVGVFFEAHHNLLSTPKRHHIRAMQHVGAFLIQTRDIGRWNDHLQECRRSGVDHSASWDHSSAALYWPRTVDAVAHYFLLRNPDNES